MSKENSGSTVGGVNNDRVIFKRVGRLNHIGEDVTNYDCNGDRIHSHDNKGHMAPNMLANPGIKKLP